MSDVAEDHTVASARASQEGEKREKFETDVEASKTEQPVAKGPDFPEGGLAGWATVAGAYVP